MRGYNITDIWPESRITYEVIVMFYIYGHKKKNIYYFRLITWDYHCDGLRFPLKCFPKKIIYWWKQLGSLMKCIYLMIKGSRFPFFWCSMQFYLYKGVATIMWSYVCGPERHIRPLVKIPISCLNFLSLLYSSRDTNHMYSE